MNASASASVYGAGHAVDPVGRRPGRRRPPARPERRPARRAGRPAGRPSAAASRGPRARRGARVSPRPRVAGQHRVAARRPTRSPWTVSAPRRTPSNAVAGGRRSSRREATLRMSARISRRPSPSSSNAQSVSRATQAAAMPRRRWSAVHEVADLAALLSARRCAGRRSRRGCRVTRMLGGEVGPVLLAPLALPRRSTHSSPSARV